MRTVIINQNDSGQRVDKFLSKLLPKMPQSLLYKALRKKRVKRNKKALSAQDILSLGDELCLYINDEFFEEKKEVTASGKDLSVLYEDQNILVVVKPAGTNAHGGDDSVLAQVQGYLAAKGEYDPKKENTFAPALSNRLDRNTEGLLLAAKNALALKTLNEKIKDGQVTKEYTCLVWGRLEKKEDTLCHYLLSSQKENKVAVVSPQTKGAKEARLYYRVVEEKGDKSLLHIDLITGRKHQIRVQMAAIGHPLVGDTKYGGKRDDRFSYQALCAYGLTFSFSDDAGPLGYLKDKTFHISPSLSRF